MREEGDVEEEEEGEGKGRWAFVCLGAGHCFAPFSWTHTLHIMSCCLRMCAYLCLSLHQIIKFEIIFPSSLSDEHKRLIRAGLP